jgi:sarcosine oxidase, subunit beta
LSTVDVAIIGGGAHGVSAAFHLVSSGAATSLFERRGPASGPTGRSSAICRAYYTNPFLARVARESLEMFRSFHEISGGNSAGFRETGALYLHSAEDEAGVRLAAERLQAAGTQVVLLSASELRSAHPDIDLAGIRLGVWEPRAGYADPVSTTQGLLQQAVALGLDARLHQPVIAVEPRAGGGAVLHTAGDRTECERLLIAAGPWTRPLLRNLGVDLPLTVERHYVATFGWSGVKPVPFVLVDVPGGFYMKPEGSELFLAGALTPEAESDPDSFSAVVTSDEVARMANGIIARVPRAAATNSRGGWASLYDVSPDWQPVIGEVMEGIFVDAGTSGHGFKLAPALGRHVAPLVVGDCIDEEIGQFHPRRFASQAALAAGFGDARILG